MINKKILITGGAGFLGRSLVKHLQSQGVNNIFVPRSKDYNLVNGYNVLRLLNDTKPNIIIHLAAKVGGIGANLNNPASFFYENAMMGMHLIHESYRARVEKIVILGTVCAYPKFCPTPFKEEDIWNGYPEETNAPYGLAKKMLNVQAIAYNKQYGFNAVMLYPANLYGPNDSIDLENCHVIPAMMRKFHSAKLLGVKEVILWGDGSPTREFLYVDDCAEGIWLATKNHSSPEPVNLGSGDEISMLYLANLIAKIVGYDGQIIWDGSKPNGQPKRTLNTEKALRFGFKAHTSLFNGLNETYKWLKTIPA